jgi:BirA family biotin operon repressor/biotin-[acetyl-CoA-carboxylase] ligase
MDSQQRVLACLADGRFHSGEKLAERLGVSRAAIWKAVRALQAAGIEIHAVRGRGYRVVGALEPLDESAIRAELTPHNAALLDRLEILPETDSTNGHLLARALDGARAGCACLAESQRSGRGRQGRRWHSPPGRNVYLSLLWRYASGPESLAGLSLAVGVAIAGVLRRVGLQEIGLKWPNDLLCRERKLGGVLLESSGESGGSCFVVVGIGLNVAMPDSGAASIDQPWCDLAGELGDATPSRNRLAGLLLDALLPLLADYPVRGLAPWIEGWNRHDVLAGREVRLQFGRETVSGRHRGVDRDGALLVEHDGRVQRYHGGEVSLRVAG